MKGRKPEVQKRKAEEANISVPEEESKAKRSALELNYKGLRLAIQTVHALCRYDFVLVPIARGSIVHFSINRRYLWP